MRVLIVGGAGYLGSHLVRLFIRAGLEVVVIDNLSSGHREMLPSDVPFHPLDMGLIRAVENVLGAAPIDCCVICAILSGANRSVRMPFPFYHNNFIGVFYLLQALLRQNVKNVLFRSSLKIYGESPPLPISPSTPRNPGTPFATSLCHCEDLLDDLASSDDLNFVSLRLGSIGGALRDGSLGALPNGSSQLVATAMDVALGSRPCFRLRGSNLPTRDGSPLVELLHICDVGNAFLQALRAIAMGGRRGGHRLNLGTGNPISVREFIGLAEDVTHRSIAVEEMEKFPGEADETRVDPRHGALEFGWCTELSMEQIIHDAWQWRQRGAEKLKNL
ncbi:MAG: NAD-dependent epimerase/dehydratase family protein [Puniceicoccales bacterium]|jgi:UDP-glucose 4-epimerase|nr:NAD-dependent epimerase/dehydratase family protein [Puniceicoccales bacterium]